MSVTNVTNRDGFFGGGIMHHLRHALRGCELFGEYDETGLTGIINHLPYHIAEFHKGQAIAIEGAHCSHLGIVITGQIEVTKTYPSGKVLTMARLGPSDVFGEAVLFTVGRYPATIVAGSDNTSVLFIGGQKLITACRADPRLFTGLLRLLSSKLLVLNRKISMVSHRTLRQNLAAYLLEESKKQGSPNIKLALSRQELADQFGVARPSLSRELALMKTDGLLDYDRQSVKLHADELEACLLE